MPKHFSAIDFQEIEYVQKRNWVKTKVVARLSNKLEKPPRKKILNRFVLLFLLQKREVCIINFRIIWFHAHNIRDNSVHAAK